MNRIRDGYVRWVNPFSRAVHKISLRPEDVMAFVLWSKNYAPLLPHLGELDARGYRMLFHFTINGLPRVFEPRVPDAADMVECAHALSDRYGADAVLWRYDPVKVPTREGCGCCECMDIGAYDTCPHGCVYCYANSRAQTALRSYSRHNPASDVLGRSIPVLSRESSSEREKRNDTHDLRLDLFPPGSANVK